MDLPDNNILINAFRPDAPHHGLAKAYLESCLNLGRPVRLFPTVEAGFLRVTTNPKIFSPPSPFPEARGFLKALCSSPHVEICHWEPEMRDRWTTLCGDLKLSGNDCNDAMLAAIALEKNLRLVTFDKGFKRFPNLRLKLLGESRNAKGGRL